MRLVATLISDPARPRLTRHVADTARQALGGVTPSVEGPDWLAPETACDFLIATEDRAAVVHALDTALGGLPVDKVVQPAEGRRKRVLVADMESTIIVNEMVDDLARYLGIEARVADITRRAMNGEIEFRPALVERVALLGGLEEELLLGACEGIKMTPGAQTLVATSRAHGVHTALVSGGFDVYSGWVARRLGFDEHHANRLIVQDGVVTGQLGEPLIGRQGKLETMRALVARQGRTVEDALAVGDGANDLDMIAAAGLGVAYHAKPAVAAVADARIDHGDLTALLYLQGYRREEFVTG